MTEVFKSKAIALGSPTVGNSILLSVAGWFEFAKQLKFKNKKAAAMQALMLLMRIFVQCGHLVMRT